MSLGFINGAYNRASGTRNAFGALSDHLVREGHPRMVSRSGDREVADQVAMFVSRYRQQASGSGSFGDVRTWDGSAWGYPGGTRWVRFSPAGTVAPPSKSNHEKRRSNDLLHPYNSNTAAARRAKTLGTIYGITREGENFGELWHWTFWGALGTIDNPATAGLEGEEDMPLTNEDLDKIATRVWAHMIQPQDENGNYVTGSFPARGFLSSAAAQAQAAKDAARGIPAAVWGHPVQAQDAQGHLRRDGDGNPVTYPARGYMASTNAQVGATVADVDEVAIAQALAPLLTANLASLSDDDVRRIATAAADEADRRERNRLAS